MTEPSKRAHRPVTLNDIADASGVSRAQVGRVLGKYGYVSAHTRARVMAAAEEHGYVPNLLARDMRRQMPASIGVIVGDIGNSYFARAVRGISDIAHAHELNVLLVNSDESAAKESSLARALQEARVGGVIVALADHGSIAHLQKLQASGIPVVLFDRSGPPEFDLVVTRNFEGGQMAVDQLWAAGHRDIGVITTALRPAEEIFGLIRAGLADESMALAHELDPDSARTAGSIARLLELGVDPTDWVRRVPRGVSGARAATAELLHGARRPTALIMTSNSTSLEALQGVKDAGVVVPDELSLLGFDDLEWATVVTPPLSVISQPAQEVGAAAARLLLERMRGERSERVVNTLPLTLTVRDSVSAPRLW
jgi:LacI family transcriptional regulator